MERPPDYRSKEYASRKAAGVCVDCGAHPAQLRRVRCADCLVKASERSTRHYRAKSEHERAERIARMRANLDRPGVRERIKENGKRRRLADRVEAMNSYGGKCACCGETEVKFLTLDHSNGDGKAHRSELRVGAGSEFYRKLREHGFPDCGLVVLCWNCHMAKDKWGECPHLHI